MFSVFWINRFEKSFVGLGSGEEWDSGNFSSSNLHSNLHCSYTREPTFKPGFDSKAGGSLQVVDGFHHPPSPPQPPCKLFEWNGSIGPDTHSLWNLFPLPQAQSPKWNNCLFPVAVKAERPSQVLLCFGKTINASLLNSLQSVNNGAD